MSLLEVRKKFVSVSGRYDLITGTLESHTDNGADFYINSGQRYLDRLLNTDNTTARIVQTLEPGQYYLNFKNCRVVEKVWVHSHESDGARTLLEQYYYDDLRKLYTSGWGAIDRGGPVAWAPVLMRVAPRYDVLAAGEQGGRSDLLDIMSGSEINFNAIVVLPPSDTQCTLEVWGKFYSPELTSDASKSYWSEMHPEILIMAAMRQVEVFYRNSAGVRDFDEAIGAAVFGLEKDMAEVENFGRNQLEG